MANDYKKIDEWQRENVRRYVIKVNRGKYPEVIDKLEQEQSVQAYIISLILDDINKE